LEVRLYVGAIVGEGENASERGTSSSRRWVGLLLQGKGDGFHRGGEGNRELLGEKGDPLLGGRRRKRKEGRRGRGRDEG